MTERSGGDDGPGDLGAAFASFSETAASRAPLYARLAAAIADDPSTARLLLHAPPEQRVPVLLFACVHWLLLVEPGHELSAWYPNLAEGGAARTDDPWPAFRAFCAHNEPRLAGLLGTRSTQTNEIGRCAIFLPVLARLADEVGDLGLLDVGTSAGLNLLVDRYRYVYESGGSVGPPGSPVELACATRGAVPVPAAIPSITSRLGIDRSPIDVREPEAAAWLEACVWPDQVDRFRRLRAAIAMARADPPPIEVGDAVDDLAGAVDRLARTGHPVVTNSWVLSYLSPERRADYLAGLRDIGSSNDLSWVMLEAPAQASGMPLPTDPTRVHLTSVTLVRWRSGAEHVAHLGVAHPHGYWLHWNPDL